MPRKNWTVEAVNARLKHHPVSLVKREKGSSVALIGTFPPKSGELKPKRRRIPVGPATIEGLQHAEEMANELTADLLAYRRKPDVFDAETFWTKWKTPRDLQSIAHENSTVATVERFKQWYFSGNTLTDKTWTRHWQKYFKRLSGHLPLNEADILRVVLDTMPNTRDRKQCCQKLQRLADWANVDVDLAVYRGSYNTTTTAEVEIPSDEDLVKTVRQIPSDIWRNWFALQLVYGLRPHEPHFVELTGDRERSVIVLEGKTGKRTVFPLEPEWVELFHLYPGLAMPKISGRDYSDITDRAHDARSRINAAHNQLLWFQLRAFRYAYVLRATVKYKFAVNVVAKWMGHSPETLLRIYSRYIDSARAIDAYRAGIGSR
ncbi:MAG: hypothetical protein AAFX40_00005 [Cyanobacteria bacterium J06639_1]